MFITYRNLGICLVITVYFCKVSITGTTLVTKAKKEREQEKRQEAKLSLG